MNTKKLSFALALAFVLAGCESWPSQPPPDAETDAGTADAADYHGNPMPGPPQCGKYYPCD